jgi:hypothetical protein
MVIRYLTRDEARELVFKEVDIDVSTINRFGIINFNYKRADGSFKKFVKKGFVSWDKGEYIGGLDVFYIAELKKTLKGKYKTTKYSLTQPKKTRSGWVTRTATDWTYEVNKS